MKLLAIKGHILENNPQEMYKNLLDNCCFVKDNDTTACFVTPYYIITDGRDIIITEKLDCVENGFSCYIKKPKGFFVCKDLEELAENAVIEDLNENFPNMKAENGNESESFIKIHHTFTAQYNFNRTNLIVFYVALLPGNKTINIQPADFLKCNPVDLKQLVRNTFDFKLSHISNIVNTMIISGQITFPISRT
jgi:hypothetical protein